MSGALVQLAAKGSQDIYLTSNENGMSLFNIKYNRHTNFAQVSKFIKDIDTTNCSIVLPKNGDIVNAIWFEGKDLLNTFEGAIFDLYIGGQIIDSQPFDFVNDVWKNYLVDTESKKYTTCSTFIALPLFFCAKKLFFPLISLHYHQIEIRISFKKQSINTFKTYANYIYVDAQERKRFASQKMDFLITQTQRIEQPINKGFVDLDLSKFNHPVKSLFFGPDISFDTGDIQMNGVTTIENMSPQFFHTIQNYTKSSLGISDFNTFNNKPDNTNYYAYHFCLDASKYEPSGTCNFSKINKCNIILRNVQTKNERCVVYAVNYNVLRIENGMAGILFGK